MRIPQNTILRPNLKPTLLVLTSSFPNSPGDETCGYIRDFAQRLCSQFKVEVLVPPDCKSARRSGDKFSLRRSVSVLPTAIDPFKGCVDLNQLLGAGVLKKLGALISLGCFFVRAAALSLRADIICSHWMLPCGLMGALISRILGKPHIVVEHSGALHVLSRRRGGRAITRWIVANSRRVVTVSADLKRKLVSLCPDAAGKTHVIPMGVQTPPARCDEPPVLKSELSEQQPLHTILFIGRLTRIKGLDVLFQALEGLDGVQLIVAGDGAHRQELEGLSRELSLEVRFTGSVSSDEREALLAQCDAVVLPSVELPDGRTEGTPVVCLEAMAAGRPVVASRVGGLGEVISDGHNGLLFDAGDHRMLREKLMLALGDDSLRERIARNARQSAGAYYWPVIASRFSRIFYDTLKDDSVGYTQQDGTRGAD
jgi:glycosyltransferase involved in cell wall biosynthesis